MKQTTKNFLIVAAILLLAMLADNFDSIFFNF